MEIQTDTQNERRETRRFPVKGGAVVNFKKKSFFMLSKNEYIQIGPVSDISFRGMSIHYFSNKNKFDESLGLTIMTKSGKIIIDDLHFETVYDIEIGVLPDGKEVRKKAVRFLDVSGYQAAWLACMIHNLSSRQSELDNPSVDERPEVLKEIF